jgi:hypothetical protein
MDNRLDIINSVIDNIESVRVIEPFTLDGLSIKGEIGLTIGETILNFSVVIHPQYPFQYHELETIKFINEELLAYDHVNPDGSICVHTIHSPDLKTKIELDFYSLKEWVKKYFIKKDVDNHYEHIMVMSAGSGKNQTLLFTEVDYKFTPGQYGQFNYSEIDAGIVKEDSSYTFILQNFKVKKETIECNWNGYLKNRNLYIGLFLFLHAPPVINRRFAVTNWNELEPFVDQDFFKYLYDFEERLRTNQVNYSDFKLILGYNINENEIHWQSISVKKDHLPNFVEKSGPKTYIGKFDNTEIAWMQTRNTSPQYFFGRGALTKRLTESRILILGIGAIGSIVSTTLVRGGCTKFFLNDYDIKEPENVCRSEYSFSTGISSKVLNCVNI